MVLTAMSSNPQLFPSPYGVTVIKSVSNAVNGQFNPFPSPYGVTVIKSSEMKKFTFTEMNVSVPLRGNGN